MVAYSTIGWNGIRMQVPASWQPAVILNNYLLLEDQYTLIFEIKWQEIKGKFSADRILRKLQKSVTDADLHRWNLPDPWQEALSRYSCQGFRWQNETRAGKGVLLYCPDCCRATLLQFHCASAGRDESCLHLLHSLRDHPEGAHQLWAVFDIRAELPVTARLVSQEFLTGRYTITFDLANQNLSLLRFKPAAELLRNQTLTEFGATLAGCMIPEQKKNPLLANWYKSAGQAERFLARLRRQHTDSCMRLWHLPEKNVLLGLKMEGKRPIDPELFEKLCTGYTACRPQAE